MASTTTTTFDVRLRYPGMHPGQQEVERQALAHLAANNNYGQFYLCAHRGWWKSSFVVRRALAHIRKGLPMGWYAPTFKPIHNAWNDLWVKVCGGQEYFDAWCNKSDKILRIPKMGEVYFYSLDEPSHAAGPTFPFIVGDEWGSLPDGAHGPIVLKILEKGLVAYEFAEAWFVGTPNREGNPNNDFKYYLDMAELGEDKDIKGWTIPVCAEIDSQGHLVYKDSPLSNPKYTWNTGVGIDIRSSYNRERDKTEWTVEYLCKFISGAGLQFRNIEAVCSLPCYCADEQTGLYLGYEVPRGPFAIGIDIGLRNDFTVITVMDLSTNRMVAFQRFLPIEWEPFYSAVRAMLTRFPGRALCDCTNIGDHVPESLSNRGIYVEGIKFNQYNKPGILDNLASLMDNADVLFFDLKVMQVELARMQRDPRPTGGIGIAAPKGKHNHDDIPISLALSNKEVLPKVVQMAQRQSAVSGLHLPAIAGRGLQDW